MSIVPLLPLRCVEEKINANDRVIISSFQNRATSYLRRGSYYFAFIIFVGLNGTSDINILETMQADLKWKNWYYSIIYIVIYDM